MKRLIIFASFSENPDVPPYILYHLDALRRFGEKLVFVTNSVVSVQGQQALANVCDEIIQRPNTGFDFAAWRDALRREDMNDWDEVLLTNSSIVGPLFDLSPVFADMQSRRCDFWGLTLNKEIKPHVQSYFLCFPKRVATSLAWTSFWSTVRDETNKLLVIRQYEFGLTDRLVKSGFVADTYIDPIVKHGRDRIGYRWTNTVVPLIVPFDRNRVNPTIRFPVELVARGFPYLKAALVWGPERRQSELEEIMSMKQVSYDWNMIGL